MKKRYDKLLNIGLILTVIIVIIIAVFVLKSSSSDSKTIQYKIVLQGERYITLSEGEEYVEPGFVAYADNEIITNQVVVESEIKNTPGIYKILYKIEDYTDYRLVEVKRNIDYELKINLESNNQALTNQDVTITATVSGDTFASLIMPDNSTIYETKASYVVKENGTYTFKAFNEKGEEFSEKIEINNIDKTNPIGSCSATLNNSNTVIKVNTSETNLQYHYYDDNKLLMTSSNSSYTSDNKTSEKIKVILEDTVTNKTTVNCHITDNRYYEQIKPKSTKNIVFHADTATLKAYVVKESNYHLTYIWVKDAYSQLNKYDSPEYGKVLHLPSTLLSKANSKYNLNDKLLIGFNASGFYLKGVYDPSTVKKYPEYDKTSVGTLVITDGKVVRNYYDKNDKTWFSVGVNKENKLLVFEDKKSYSSSERKDWAEKVINSGIRNTFTFAAPLIKNGKETNITTSMPPNNDTKYGLQIICQINENNFLLFSTPKSVGSTRNTAIKVFKKLNCQTAMNLDGGGSVALLYKKKGSNEIKTILGNGRKLTEVAYFSE